MTFLILTACLAIGDCQEYRVATEFSNELQCQMAGHMLMPMVMGQHPGRYVKRWYCSDANNMGQRI